MSGWLLISSLSWTCNFQVRNKPIEPPKKPEKAPFFLPSVPSLSGEILFNPSKTENGEKDTKVNEVENKRRESDMPPSQFLQHLQSSMEMKNCKYAKHLFDYFWMLWIINWVGGVSPLGGSVTSSEAHHWSYFCVLHILQFQHLLIILKVCLHQLWTWNFECFKL